MKVWIVNADDHDYDEMSSWCVGAFSSEEKANAAEAADRKAYRGHLKKRGGPHYEIIETEIDMMIGDD